MQSPSAQRSRNMSLIRSKDTGPELRVRKLVHAMGFRYRLHRKDLPGKPDMVFGPRRRVILIHGCYWHAHLRYEPSCKRARPAKTNVEYWGPKLERNMARDQSNLRKLQDIGWQVLVLWECELKDDETLSARIRSFLE
ncbi:very short patch repair endonuclease [Rhizobium sp. IMFF44]|uniref:very short patch repair endonuclease n=1 Tax=Rhizobium sp. IMFF44 TaxID=3342350 RepID=UPI0035BB7142